MRGLPSVVLFTLGAAGAAEGCSSDPAVSSGVDAGSSASSGGLGSSSGTAASGVFGGGSSGVDTSASGSPSGTGSASGASGSQSASGGSGDESGAAAAPDSSVPGDAASAADVDQGGEGGTDGATASGGDASASPDGTAGFSQWIEAEAVPPNVLTNGAQITTCAGSAQYGRGLTCAPDTLKEGALCCSGGKVVVSLLGRAANNAGSGVEFHQVSVPSAGSYDVTWWYHCGANDSFGDVGCGGLHYPVGSSCRPHLIDVNGMPITSTVGGASAQFFQFPCYQGDWSIIHAATTTLPLQAGNNVIYVHPPHVANLDAADIDVIHVTAVGQGVGQRVTPVVVGN